MNFDSAIKELRKSKTRAFDETLDIIANLKGIDIKKQPIVINALLPHAFHKPKVIAFLDSKNKVVDSITKAELGMSDKEKKKISKKYDFFLSSAALMPVIATAFGKVLGPLGKMPNPKIGTVLAKGDEEEIKRVLQKLEKTIMTKTKELSIKSAIGKRSMPDAQLVENAGAFYNAVLQAVKQENIKNVMLKFTMSKTLKVK